MIRSMAPAAEDTLPTLEQRLEFETLIADLLARFVSVGAQQLDVAIRETVRRLGEFLDADRGAVAQLDDTRRTLVFSHFWSRTGAPPVSPMLDAALLMPYGLSKLLRGEMHAFSSVSELPPDAADRQYFALTGTKAAIVLPLMVEGRVIGSLGFGSFVERQWDATLTARLRSVADVLSVALSRARLDADLRKSVEERVTFETLIADIASSFVNLDSDRVDSAIEAAQRQLVEVLDIDRSALFEFDDQIPVLTHFWSRPEFPHPPIERGSAATMFPWISTRIRAGETVCLTSTDDIPASVPDRDHLQRMGTRATAILPLFVSDRVIGALTFGSLRAARTWPPDTVNRLRLIAQVFANALARRRTASELRLTLQENGRLRERLLQENVQLRDEVIARRGPSEILGQSQAIQSVLEQIDRVAPTDTTVLLLGETGTGKELIARAIHERSRRGARTLISVNCGAIPATLIESELFGREKGAYTGAVTRQIGRFELADASTIFLDEIGDLPPETQAKLLRALQEREIERLGGSLPIQVNVRVIAATNRDLEEMIGAGTFREDLYYRLNVFPIRVPALRERPEDIPPLVWAFVDEFSRAFGRRVESISKERMLALQHYRWPGNIRELRNIVERAFIATSGPRLAIEPPMTRGHASRRSMRLEDVEREHIRSVLDAVGWRVRGTAGAADILGLKPSTLESRMARQGLTRKPR